MRKVIPLLAAGLLLGAFATSAVAKPGPVPQATVGTNPKTNYMTNDQAIDPTGGFSNGPTVAVTAGTFLVTGSVYVTGNAWCQISDPAGTIASGYVNDAGTIALSGFAVETATVNIRWRCKVIGGYDQSPGTSYTIYIAADAGLGKTASQITVYQTGP